MLNKKKKISIIVPVYNVQRFLRACVSSILDQTYGCFELILVDDGSPDKCGEICDELAEMDSRIRVVHKKNGGLSSARNAGIDIALGDYITFVDSDDFVYPRYLENLVSVAEKNVSDLVSVSYIRVSENSSRNLADESVKFSVKHFEDDKMLAFLKDNEIGTMAWGKLYKSSLFSSLRFPDKKYHEDLFTTYLAVHLAKKISVCDCVEYAYRMNEKSIVSEKFSVKKMDAIEGVLCRLAFIEREYPSLKKYAFRSVVYYCNQVLLSMGRARIWHKESARVIQDNYRRYVFSYVFMKTSFFGKIFALVSTLNVRGGWILARYI